MARLDQERLFGDVEADVAPFRELPIEERAAILASVCRDAWRILTSRPDFERAVQFRDARSAESEATWLALVAQHRRRLETDGRP